MMPHHWTQWPISPHCISYFTNLDFVSRLRIFLCCQVILPLLHADFCDAFQDPVTFLDVILAFFFAWRQLLHQFLRHWYVLFHANLQSIPVLCFGQLNNISSNISLANRTKRLLDDRIRCGMTCYQFLYKQSHKMVMA